MIMYKKALRLLCALLVVSIAMGCLSALGEEQVYSYEVFPLERNGISLHFDCMKTGNSNPAKHILLIQGSTYSSHEFDINYQDYMINTAITFWMRRCG